MSDQEDELRESVERYEQFVRDTILPLFTKGSFGVGRPLTPGMFAVFSVARSADALVDHQVYEALHRSSRGIAPIRQLPWPDAGFIGLAMASHNLVALTDPLLDRAFSRSARPKLIKWATFFIDQVEMAQTRGEVLARHALLRRVFSLRRTDIYARSLGTTSRYLGRPESRGFWSRPRFANRRVTQVGLSDLWAGLEDGLEVEPLLNRMLLVSPITRLMDVQNKTTPPMLGVADLAVLSDDLLRSGIANQMVEQGLTSGVWWGDSIRAMQAREAPRSLLYYPLTLAVEAAAIAVLSEDEQAMGAMSTGGGAFAAFLAAALDAPPRLSFFSDYSSADLERLRSFTAQVRQTLGEEMLQWASYLIHQANPPQLSHEQLTPQIEVPT